MKFISGARYQVPEGIKEAAAEILGSAQWRSLSIG